MEFISKPTDPAWRAVLACCGHYASDHEVVVSGPEARKCCCTKCSCEEREQPAMLRGWHPFTAEERAEIDAEMTACLREVNRLVREGGTVEEQAASRREVERLVARIEAGR